VAVLPITKEKLAYVRDMADLTRYNLLAMLTYCGSGHPGGSLSVVEILSALYYGGVLRYDPGNPQLPDRDRLVLSKGHASPAQYIILAELGFFPKEWLKEFDANGSRLPKHCNRFLTPGIEASTGALGQGISMSVGMALAQKMDFIPYNIYCIIGDGECQSGNLYEAVIAAGKYKLDNMKVILDKNGLQIDGNVEEIMPLGDVGNMWSAMGWKVWSCDGHNVENLLRIFEEMKDYKGKPQLLIANTIKGKGVSFMENNVDWHSDKINHQQGVLALEEAAALLAGSNRQKSDFLSKEELQYITTP